MGAVEGEPKNPEGQLPAVNMLNIGDALAEMLPYEPANKSEVVSSLLNRLGLEPEMTDDELELELLKRLLRFNQQIKQNINSNDAQQLSIFLELLDKTKGAGGIQRSATDVLDEQFDDMLGSNDLIQLLPPTDEAISSLLQSY